MKDQNSATLCFCRDELPAGKPASGQPGSTLTALVSVLTTLQALAALQCALHCAVQALLSNLALLHWLMKMLPWTQAQEHTRLCAVRDLCEHDIVSRVMRRENYLIGMLNKGCLALNVPLPGLRKHFMMTKTLEWSLQWCLLGAMFDKDFRIHPDFIADERKLQRRFR